MASFKRFVGAKWHIDEHFWCCDAQGSECWRCKDAPTFMVVIVLKVLNCQRYRALCYYCWLSL